MNGHLNKSCKLQSRCVKCNGAHHYSQCDKMSKTSPNCVNCKGAHPNYKGCIYFKNIINKKILNPQTSLENKNEPIINPTKDNSGIKSPKNITPNQTSYADIIKGKTNITFDAIKNMDSTYLLIS